MTSGAPASREALSDILEDNNPDNPDNPADDAIAGDAPSEASRAPETAEPAPARVPEGPPFRCGFVGLAGKPNAGKSTLVNAIVGDKLAIVTPKAQTTRDRVLGFHTTGDAQAILVDMPGLIEPRDRFNEALMDIAADALAGVDLCYHLADARDPDPFPDHIARSLRAAKAKVFLVWTHVDLLEEHQDVAEMPPEAKALYSGVFAISGTEGFGIAELLAKTLPLLPEGPALYPPDELTDRSMRYLASEIVREKVFLNLDQEIPYGVACETEQFDERPGQTDYIRVTIHVEKPSHKGIVIGAGGQTLKAIGSAARLDIERLCGANVFLDLWVKVRKDWRRSDRDLKYFGYAVEKKKRKQ